MLNRNQKIKKQMIGIYKITSPTGKVYIGQSWDIKRRWSDHKSASMRSRLKSSRLVKSIEKYGMESHSLTVLHELPEDVAQAILDVYEQLYMDVYKESGCELLNLKAGGSRGKHAEETKEKLSAIKIGRPLSEEHKAKLSKATKGIPKSDEHKQKLSALRTGITLTDEHKEKLTGPRKKYGSWKSGNGNQWQAKRVVDMETGIVYETIAKAAETVGLKRRTLEDMLKGVHKNKTHLAYDI